MIHKNTFEKQDIASYIRIIIICYKEHTLLIQRNTLLLKITFNGIKTLTPKLNLFKRKILKEIFKRKFTYHNT